MPACATPGIALVPAGRMGLEFCASSPGITEMGREVFVPTAATSQSLSRPVERRRHPRHKVPSIMYVELDSGNGGIVVNLGTDGMACQAANRVTTPKNSTLRIRLRGSGLSTEVDGKLVWLGATQKEVGISFSEVSSEARQNIEDWIAREFQVGNSPAGNGRLRSKVTPTLPGMSSTGMKSPGRPLSAAPALSGATTAPPDTPVEKSVKEFTSRPNAIPELPGVSSVEKKSPIYPLSAALAMSQAAAETSAPADAPAKKSVSGSIIPAVETSSAAAPLESDPPVRNTVVAAGPVDVTRSNAQIAGSPVNREQSRPEPILPGAPVSEIPSVENAASPASGISLMHAFAEKPVAALNEEQQPLDSAPVPATVEISKKVGSVVPAPASNYLEAWERFVKSVAWERWIPPALIETWNKASRRHRFALAGTAAVCLLSFLLILIFAVNSFVGGSAAEGSKPQSAAAETTIAGRVRNASAPAQPRVIVPPPSDASDGMIATFIDTLFNGSDKAGTRNAVALDEGHFGVQVWTSKTSGYYYCTDEPYYKSIRPGAYMSQRDALQSGYQPKLGQFCD